MKKVLNKKIDKNYLFVTVLIFAITFIVLYTIFSVGFNLFANANWGYKYNSQKMPMYFNNFSNNNKNDFDEMTESGYGERGNGFGMMNGGRNMQNSEGSCYMDGCLNVNDLQYPVTTKLTTEVVEALNRAIDDEYKAYSTYSEVINKFGSVRPFIMIIRAEEQHISALKSLFDKYGLTIPQNNYQGKVVAPLTLNQACSVGVTAEVDNANLYKNNLLPKVTNYSDITSVFTTLMNASAQNHLPAFERCAN